MEEDAKKWLWWGIPIVVAAGLLAALYYGRKHQEESPAQQQVSTQPAAPAPTPPPDDYPIEPAAADAKPLPALADSDAELHESLSGAVGRALDDFLVPKEIVRHIVVTVDNLTRKKTSVQLRPVKPTGGQLMVSGTDQQLTLSTDNFARYEPLMKVLRNTDTRQVAAVYKRFYPLFQQAYTELGYPDSYFNNRLVAVIDHLLETPEVQGPIKLVQPSVFYQFADPALEERSAGQKLLIRMGPENAATVKIKLRELRREVVNQADR
ncbi:MAG TPA: DUF3014 domain-containing protein [Povalibacter sp.]|nr:DUF3014 domain-containing protein [Povalibacter sp.]